MTLNVALFIIIIAAAVSVGALAGTWRERYVQSLDDRAARFMADRHRTDAINDAADQAITGDERGGQL
jgi:hypothetical protein